MNFKSYLLKNSSIRLAVYGVGIASAFIVTPHIISSMGSNLYSVWVLIASLFPYFDFCNFATSNVVSTLFAKAEAEESEEQLQQLLVNALQLTCIATFSTITIATIYYFISSNEYTNYVTKHAFIVSLYTYTINVALYQYFNIGHGFLAGRMKWSVLAVTSMLRVLFSSICALLFISPENSADTNLIYIALINSFSLLLEALINFSLAKKYMPRLLWSKLLSNPFNTTFFNISRALSIATLGKLLSRSTQVYLIAAFVSANAVTFYSLTKQIIAYMTDLLLSAFGIFTPYFTKLQSQKNYEESQNVLLLSTYFSYGFASIITMGLIFYGDLFFIRWVGEEFSGIGILLTPMALASLIECGNMPCNSYILGMQKQNILAKISIYEGFVVVCISMPALLLFGLAGIGWAIFINTFIFKVIYLSKQASKISNISLFRYYIYILLALLPTCIIQGIYYYFVKDYVVAEYLNILAIGFVQGILALATLVIISKFCLDKIK